MKIYILCPVRKPVTKAEEKFLGNYVKRLREKHIVHYPRQDIDQTLSEFDICMINCTKISECDEVHVYWKESSKASPFDFGAAFILKKPIKLINTVKKTDDKSLVNLLVYLDQICRKR